MITYGMDGLGEIIRTKSGCWLSRRRDLLAVE
jgi:hypothetical protein